MHKHGIKDEWGSVGTQDYLMGHYHLTAADMAKAALELLK
jgi:transketolase C-terminal domain/subunit